MQSGQVLPEPCAPYDDFFSNGDDFNYDNNRYSCALFDMNNAPWLPAASGHPSKVLESPQTWDLASLPTAGGTRKESCVSSMDVDSTSIDSAAYGSLSDIEYGGILFPGSSTFDIAQSPTSDECQQHILQRAQSNDHGSFSSQSDFNSDYTTACLNEYEELALQSSTDTEWYAKMSGTASSSSIIHPAFSTVDATSLPDIDTLRQSRALHLPPSTRDPPPSSDTVETLSSNGSSSCPTATLPSPVSAPTPTPAPALAPAPKPRRGRPPKYSRPLESTSSQDLAREQNRLAAQRFRGRREAYLSSVRVEAEDLEAVNKDLKNQLARLREEKLQLRGGMLNHAHCVCGLAEKFLEGEMKTLNTESAEEADEKKVSGERKSTQQ